MDDFSEPPAIASALKDLKRFLKSGTPATGFRESYGSYMSSHSPYYSSGNPKLKLNFNDTTIINEDSDEFEEDSSNIGSNFIKKQRDSVAGFDITKKIREKDIQVIDANNKISVLEAKLSCLETLNEKAKIEYETELHGLRKKQMRDMELIGDLRHQVKVLSERKQDVKDDALLSRKAAEDNYAALEQKLLNFRSKELEKVDKLKEEMSSLKKHCMDLEADVSEKNSTLSIVNSDKQHLEQQMMSYREKMITMEKSLHHLDEAKVQIILEQTKNKELQCRLSELENFENHQISFEQSLQNVPLLEKELAKVKDENLVHKITAVNTGLLEEKVNAANSQIRLLENRCSEMTEENGNLIALRKFSEEFECVIKDEFELSYMPPVSELVQRLKEIRKGDKELSRSIEQLRQSLKSHEKTKHHQDIHISKLNTELTMTRTRSAKMEEMVKRLQRKLMLMSKERDNLRELIDSYKTETFLGPSAADQQRVDSLEEELKAYKNENSRLEAELQMAGKDELCDENILVHVKSLEKKVCELEEKICVLCEEKEKIEIQLQYHINKGGYDVAKTRVLQFTDNPMSKACTTLSANVEEIMQENEGLKKRIKLMKEGEQLNLTQQVGMKVKESQEHNVKELEDKLHLIELQNKRLIEAFKEKSSEMREVVYRLTGYRVDVKNDSRYKISNMYADTSEDYLLFVQTPTGEIELLETDFSSTLESLIETHLTEQNSFPCFLSALTLDLFSRQTMIMPDNTLREEEEEAGLNGLKNGAQNEYSSENERQNDDIGSGTEYVEQDSENEDSARGSEASGDESSVRGGSSASSVSRMRSDNSERGQSEDERGRESEESEEEGAQSDDERGQRSGEDGEVCEEEFLDEEEMEEGEGDGAYEEYEEEGEEYEEERPFKRRRQDEESDDEDLICLD